MSKLSSFKNWMKKAFEEPSPEQKQKSLEKEYEILARWLFAQIFEFAQAGVGLDKISKQSLVKRDTKTFFKHRYNDTHYREVLKLVNRKIEKIGLEESKQQGGPKSKRSKSDEKDIASHSEMYKPVKIEGWEVKPTIHAAAQEVERAPEMDEDDWKAMHRRAVWAIKDGKHKRGDFIVFSKSFDRGYVLTVDNKKRQIRIITVLPKGRKNPKPGTDLLMVESVNDLIYVEIE